MTAWQQIVGAMLTKTAETWKPSSTHRTCSACKQELPVTSFYSRSDRSPDSYLSRCKACQAAYNRERKAMKAAITKQIDDACMAKLPVR